MVNHPAPCTTNNAKGNRVLMRNLREKFTLINSRLQSGEWETLTLALTASSRFIVSALTVVELKSLLGKFR